jgi:hypothetical protein
MTPAQRGHLVRLIEEYAYASELCGASYSGRARDRRDSAKFMVEQALDQLIPKTDTSVNKEIT